MIGKRDEAGVNAPDVGARALGIFERELGPDHPNTLRSRNNLADSYPWAGRAEAIPLHERTLADRERTLGPDHPELPEQPRRRQGVTELMPARTWSQEERGAVISFLTRASCSIRGCEAGNRAAAPCTRIR